MKLASLNKGRDGQLVIVSHDLTKAISATDIVPTLQLALEQWSHVKPLLHERSTILNAGNAKDTFHFDQASCASPLPRAYQWADGSAYVNHVELVRKARNAEMPDSFWHDPLMYQGGSDSFIGPHDDIPLASEDWGIDFEAEVAVITDDVPMGCSAEHCEAHIKLIMLVNDVSLRGLIPAELAKGFGFFQSKPSSAFSPVAITPDELSQSWKKGRVFLPLQVDYNNQPFGKANAGEDMIFNFPQLIAHAAKTRPLCAGSIVGSGTISNKQNTEHGSAIKDGGLGYSCIAELRSIETINEGKPTTSFMKFGDTVRIQMNDTEGFSIFGRIDQQIVKYEVQT